MTTRQSLEGFLEYHDFKAWKKITEGIPQYKLEAYLASFESKDILIDIVNRPQELRAAILNGSPLEPVVITDKNSEDEPTSFAPIEDDAKSDESDSLGKVIRYLGWPILFFIWLSTEPYGSYLNSDEINQSILIFFVGLIIWVAVFGTHKFRLPKMRMITTPFKIKAKNYSTNRMKNEIQDFITLLRAADDEEVALALVAAVDFRNHFLAETKIDLFEPRVALIADDTLTIKFSRQIEDSQAEGGILTAPLLVWAHTLRAIQNPMVREQGREMWAELQRGLENADDKIDSLEFFIGRKADLTGLGEVPDGLTPRNSFVDIKPPKGLSHTEQETELLRLKSLFERGLLTKEVYEQRQREILG